MKYTPILSIPIYLCSCTLIKFFIELLCSPAPFPRVIAVVDSVARGESGDIVYI